jgi:hypothetical protein
MLIQGQIPKDLVRHEQAQDLIEYTLLVAFVSLAGEEILRGIRFPREISA